MISRIISNDNLAHEIMIIDRKDKEFVNTYMNKLEKPALYILVNRETNKLYIGQTEDSLTRLKNHEAKEFWTEAIVFHSKMNTLSTTEVRWLEAKTYEVVADLGYFDLSENIQKPKYPPLKEDQDIELEPVFEEAKRYICAAGFDIFMKRREVGKWKEKNIFDYTFPNSNNKEHANNGERTEPKDSDQPRLFSMSTLPAYVNNLKSEKTLRVMKKMKMGTDIAKITDLQQLESLLDGIKEMERGLGIHHTHSCALSKYIAYIKEGMNFSDMEHDAMLVKNVKKEGNETKPAKATTRRKPSAPFKFSMIEMPVGTIITFKPTGVTVKVTSDNTIEYQRVTYSLSGFCKKFMPEDKQIPTGQYQGPAYFEYQGKTLKRIRKEKEE